MARNEILDEIYAAREALLAQHGGDLHAYIEAARQRALSSLSLPASQVGHAVHDGMWDGLRATLRLLQSRWPRMFRIFDSGTRRGCEQIGAGTSQVAEFPVKVVDRFGASPILSQPRSMPYAYFVDVLAQQVKRIERKRWA